MDTHLERVRGRVVGPLGLVLLLVLVQVLVGGVAYMLWSRTDEAAVSGSECDRYRTVEVAVAPAMFGVVSHAAESVAPACTRVEPMLREGSQVALGVSAGQGLPDVWIGDARFWMTPTYLGQDSGLRLVSPSLARTPVLLVGGPEGRRFRSWGEAEASGLVSVPDPSRSSVGSMAVMAPQTEAAALGIDPVQARQQVVPFAQSYGERHARGLDTDVRPASVAPTSRRLVVGTEQDLVGAGAAAAYLRDLTPAVGAPVLDFPLAVRRDGPPGSRVVARGLARYFTSDVGVRALQEAGLREPGAAPEAGLGAQVAAYLAAPRPRAVAETVQSWRTLSVPSSILAVVDASGSMDFATAGGTRMEVLADAAEIGLSFLPDHARVGLWIFSIDKGGPSQDWRELEPVRPLDRVERGRTQRDALRAQAEGLPGLTGGGTGLYDTALAAYRQALRVYRPGFSNAVVLMTDGENEDPGSISLTDLVGRLRDLRDPARPVRVVGIAISGDADLGALQRMADATGGQAYLAEEPEDILGVFAQAVLSR